MSEVQPLVLFVEDLHWCDVSTLEFLGHVIAQSPTERVLLVATARPEFTAPWPARSNTTTLPLARLTKRQARDMIATLAGTDLPAATLDALVARADGVPLYVEELTKSVVEPGTARDVEAIPATLADSLMARLDRLSTAKEVAQRAAVLGREFGDPLLAATAGLDEAALRQGLGRLADAEILFARGEPPASTYTFKHALIQETAYQSLLKRTRQQLHARVGEVLEERFPERVASEPEVVARHYEQAGLVAQAIAHYQRAGEGATQRSANEEAIGHLRRALDLVGALPETRERHQMELGLQMALGVPLTAARGFSHRENEQAHARARELALQIGESRELARVLAELADVYLVKADLATSLEVAQEALVAAERMGAAFDLISAHYQVGSPLLWQGHFSRALQHYDHVITLYDPAEHGSLVHTVGHDRGITAHSWAAMCHLYLGYPDRAFAVREKALALAKRLGHPFSLGLALYVDGVDHFERGEVDRARERAQEVVALSEQLRFPTWLALGKATQGWARAQSGEGEAGIAEIQQALVDLNQVDTRVTLPWLDFWHSDSLRKVGRHRDALDELGRGLAQTERLGNHYYDAELHRLRAEILLDMDGNAAPEAEALFGQSLAIARRQEAKTFELRAATSLARLWQRQGKHAAARALLAPLYAWFTEGFATRDLKEAKALLDALA